MLKSSLFDCSDAYILLKRIITVCWSRNNGTERATGKENEQVILKIFAPFTDCVSKINNTQADNTKDIDVAILMYNLKEYSDNC